MYRRYIRTIIRMCHTAPKNYNLTAYHSHTNLFQDYFEIPASSVNDFIESNRLAQIKLERIINAIEFCQSLGYSNEALLKNPILLRAHTLTLDQHYMVMTEAGFISITPTVLAKFRTLIKQQIRELKHKNLIPKDADVAKNFINHLNPIPPDISTRIKHDDSQSLQEIHLKILSAYLEWRLEATSEQILKIIKTHPTIRNKSFRYTCESIAIAEELGFTKEKILKYGYLIQAYPKFTKTILERYANIAGACMKKAMRMYPKLVTTNPANIEEIFKILKEHNIPDIAIQKRMNIFHISPKTVETRLKELEEVSDFKVLLKNPGILKLVIHYNRAKSRLAYLKKLDLKCSGLAVLGNDNLKFHHHVRGGRDINAINDIYNFIRGLFVCNIDNFELILKRHPYYLHVPFTSMEDAFDYLKSQNFREESILQVLYILLYPREKIIDALHEVQQFQEERRQIFPEAAQLNLAVYFMEREHHFTGSGIWDKDESNEAHALES